MKKIIPLMILIITVGCSQYSSYDDCFVNEMSKMPEGLEGKRGINSLQAQFRSSVRKLCKEQFPN